MQRQRDRYRRYAFKVGAVELIDDDRVLRPNQNNILENDIGDRTRTALTNQNTFYESLNPVAMKI